MPWLRSFVVCPTPHPLFLWFAEDGRQRRRLNGPQEILRALHVPALLAQPGKALVCLQNPATGNPKSQCEVRTSEVCRRDSPSEGGWDTVSATCDTGLPATFLGPFAGDVSHRRALPDHQFLRPSRRLMKRQQKAEDVHDSRIPSRRGLSIYTMPWPARKSRSIVAHCSGCSI